MHLQILTLKKIVRTISAFPLELLLIVGHVRLVCVALLWVGCTLITHNDIQIYRRQLRHLVDTNWCQCFLLGH